MTNFLMFYDNKLGKRRKDITFQVSSESMDEKRAKMNISASRSTAKRTLC